MNEAYAKAGVDVNAGYRSVELIKGHVRGTFRPGVLSDIGGFGGMFALSAAKCMEEPVMVSGTDGVGTKLMLAFLMDKHDTVGIDCVAMCVNDIVCAGAEPLFFLDYIACGKNEPAKIEQIVKGVAEGCRLAGAALLGGETAEHPGMMPPEEYDLAGFAAGIAERKSIIDGSRVKVGDVLLGVASSGMHSNGFSLARQAMHVSKDNVNQYISELGTTLGETMLTPTKIYVKSILSLIKTIGVKGISNITGGGFQENVPRMLPDGLAARITTAALPVPPIFSMIQRAGDIPKADMYNTFNMGVGMVICVSPDDADAALKALKETGEEAKVIGEVISNDAANSAERVCLE